MRVQGGMWGLVWAGAATAVAAQSSTCRSEASPQTPPEGASFFDSGGQYGDYGNSENCWTRLHCPGERVRLSVRTFHTESLDTLTMFEGSATSHREDCELRELRGYLDSPTTPIVSDGEYLWLNFRSDMSVREPGYQASYTCTTDYQTTSVTVCSGDVSGGMTWYDNSCAFSRDGMCDEPSLGSLYGACDPNTDCQDCNQPCSNECTGDCAAAASAVLLIICLGCVGGAAGLGGGIYCCINNKSQQNLRPTGTAWVAALLLCFFVGPLCMWIPFVIDSCYEPTRQQTTVIVRAPTKDSLEQ